MVNYNQIIVKIRFLFFVSAKTMHIGSFAQNTFNRCPQNSRSIFGPLKEILEKIETQGLFNGQIQSNQHEMKVSFFRFHKKDAY